MERLTERTTDGILVKEDYGEDVLITLYQCYGAEPMPHYANCDEGHCAMEKLAEYEDLEERLHVVYGECDELLEMVVEHLEHHENVDIDKHLMINGRKAPYPYGFVPVLHRYRLNDYIGKKGRNIFVCSMADLFGEWVPDSWIEEVFKACEKAPQHNYLFLTKNPARYVDMSEKGILKSSDNMWYGSTVTAMEEYFSSEKMYNAFLSIEPMLSSVSPSTIEGVKWIIIGAETGMRKDRVIPKKEWIERIAEDCKRRNIPLFMKSSLADIWGEPLIQEFPIGLLNK